MPVIIKKYTAKAANTTKVYTPLPTKSLSSVVLYIILKTVFTHITDNPKNYYIPEAKFMMRRRVAVFAITIMIGIFWAVGHMT